MRAFLLLVLMAWAATPAAAEGDVVPRRDPNTTLTQSLAVPGWGQRTNGEPNKGAAYLGGAALSLAVALDLIGIGEGNDRELVRRIGLVSYLLTTGAAAHDAYRTSQRLNRENGYDLTARPPDRIRLVVVSLRF